jgi:hypothetical protein
MTGKKKPPKRFFRLKRLKLQRAHYTFNDVEEDD